MNVTVYIIFRACSCELTLLIGANHKPSRIVFFATPVYQMSLKFVFVRNTQVVRFVGVVCK